MTTIGGLKPNIARLLDAVIAHIAEHGTGPTYPQLSAATGLAPGTLSAYLSIVEARGYIRRPGPGTGYRVVTRTDRPWPPAATATTESAAAA